MSNIGGLEILMVLLVALVVLGPTKLPEAARQIGRAVTEVRRISAGFQREFREAIQDPIIEAEARARGAVEGAKSTVDNVKSAVADPFLKPMSPSGPTETGPTVPADPATEPADDPVNDDD